MGIRFRVVQKNMSPKLNVVPIDVVLKRDLLKNKKLIKEVELKLAACVSEHDLSFNIMNHLPKLIKSICRFFYC